MSLKITNLNYKNILSSIDLMAKSGESVAVIGPNGAGKSTLLKLIATVITPEKRAVFLDGVDVRKLSVREVSHRISYLAQTDSVANMSVLELLEAGKRARSGAFLSAKDKESILQIATQFELTKLLEKNLLNISGGERQKAHIASLLLEKSRLLLLDEPISWLDPKNQIDILTTIRSATKAQNLISVVVLHDLTHALNFADRVVMMKSGKKLYDSSDPDEKMLKDLYEIDIKIVDFNRKKVAIYD